MAGYSRRGAKKKYRSSKRLLKRTSWQRRGRLASSTWSTGDRRGGKAWLLGSDEPEERRVPLSQVGRIVGSVTGRTYPPRQLGIVRDEMSRAALAGAEDWDRIARAAKQIKGSKPRTGHTKAGQKPTTAQSERPTSNRPPKRRWSSD